MAAACLPFAVCKNGNYLQQIFLHGGFINADADIIVIEIAEIDFMLFCNRFNLCSICYFYFQCIEKSSIAIVYNRSSFNSADNVLASRCNALSQFFSILAAP